MSLSDKEESVLCETEINFSNRLSSKGLSDRCWEATERNLLVGFGPDSAPVPPSLPMRARRTSATKIFLEHPGMVRKNDVICANGDVSVPHPGLKNGALLNFAPSGRDRSEGAGGRKRLFSQPASAPSREADIAKVQEWLGHANVSTMRRYNGHKMCSGEQPGCCQEGHRR
jgi:hypothetical protein